MSSFWIDFIASFSSFTGDSTESPIVSSVWNGTEFFNCKFTIVYYDAMDVYEIWGHSDDYDHVAPFFYNTYLSLDSIEMSQLPQIIA